jgi:hypothetical protein
VLAAHAWHKIQTLQTATSNGAAMYTVFFKDERSGREGSRPFDTEQEARAFIQSLAEDHWQRFVRAERADGSVFQQS